MTFMGKSFSTVLLAIAAFVMVAAGAFVLTSMALSDSDEDSGSAGSAESGEQHVYLTNLGMT
jgi:hypothetical protein